jgi:hypothetical protein
MTLHVDSPGSLELIHDELAAAEQRQVRNWGELHESLGKSLDSKVLGVMKRSPVTSVVGFSQKLASVRSYEEIGYRDVSAAFMSGDAAGICDVPVAMYS